jgi:acyl-CoA reductase-like NAD-dependent aldehyde dehydrogenase
VCEDVHIETIVPKHTVATFLNSREICTCVKRIYIHESIYDKFRDAMVEFTKKNIKTGGASSLMLLLARSKILISTTPFTYSNVKLFLELK